MVRRDIETDAAVVALQDGVVRIIGTGAPHTRETVKQVFDVVQHVAGDSRVPILIDARNWGQPDLASWVEFVKQIDQVCYAAAVLLDPGTDTRAGAFPDVLDRLVIPFRPFVDIDDAWTFLRSRITERPDTGDEAS